MWEPEFLHNAFVSDDIPISRLRFDKFLIRVEITESGKIYPLVPVRWYYIPVGVSKDNKIYPLKKPQLQKESMISLVSRNASFPKHFNFVELGLINKIKFKYFRNSSEEVYDLYSDIGYIVTTLKSHSSPGFGIYINRRGMEQIVVNFVTAREKYGK